MQLMRIGNFVPCKLVTSENGIACVLNCIHDVSIVSLFLFCSFDFPSLLLRVQFNGSHLLQSSSFDLSLPLKRPMDDQWTQRRDTV